MLSMSRDEAKSDIQRAAKTSYKIRYWVPRLDSTHPVPGFYACQHGQSAPLWQGPSSAPAPPQGAPGGPVQLSTPRVGPGHWDPSHGLSCSS